MESTEGQEALVFISYRRQDSSAAARWLFQTIQRTFGPSRVFMDTEGIRIGSSWPDAINNALNAATVLIAIIGPSWLRIADEFGQRRIDKEDDWVRNEISFALETKEHVIPLLLSGTALPDQRALPDCMQNLTRHQAFELRDDRWEPDLNLLVSKLEGVGLKKISGQAVRYPTPRITLKELSRKEIEEALASVPGWEIVISEIPGREPLKRTELRKAFEFASFEDAIRFMNEAAQHVSQVQHHPRWENIWRTVTVCLSTWDIGHKPSKLDVELAHFLDDLYGNYPQPRKKSS